jgi:hypothetical protein
MPITLYRAGMTGLSAAVALAIVFAMASPAVAQHSPAWWRCINSTAAVCPGYLPPCPLRNTVETAVARDVIAFAIAGRAVAIYALLSPAATFSLPQLGAVASGRRNVSIALASGASVDSRAGYYHIDHAANATVEIYQEGYTVVAVIERPIQSPFRPSQLTERLDRWRIDFDSSHAVVAIEVLLDTWRAGAGTGITVPLALSADNVISWGFPADDAPYYRCLGRRGPCAPLYENPCNGVPLRHSVQKSVFAYIIQDVTVGLRYGDISRLFAPAATMDLFGLNVHFETPHVIASYYSLGDPALTEATFIVLNATIRDTLELPGAAVGRIDWWFLNPQALDSAPFLLRTWHRMRFDSARRVREYVQETDTQVTIDNFFYGVDFNRTRLCSDIMASCTGGYVQFPSHASCLSFMQTVPDDVSGVAVSSTSGFSIRCRRFHASMTPFAPDVHCVHAGPQNIDPSATPCNDYA